MSVLPGSREPLFINEPNRWLDAMEAFPHPKPLKQPASPLGQTAQAAPACPSLGSGVRCSPLPGTESRGRKAAGDAGTAGMQWGRKLLARRRGGERNRRNFVLLLITLAPLEGRERSDPGPPTP